MKYLLLLPLASSSSVLAAVIIALPIGTGRYAAAFLLGLVQAGAIVLAARDEKPEKSVPISYFGQDVRVKRREYSSLVNVPRLPSRFHRRRNGDVPDKRDHIRLYRLIENEYGEGGRSIPREGVKLDFRLLAKYKFSRERAEILRRHVLNCWGYETAGGVVYMARGHARRFMGEGWGR